MQIKQGSLPWLLRHELRLWWRTLRGKWFAIGLLIVLGLLATLLLGIWLFAASQVTELQPWVFGELPPELLWPAVLGWFGLFCYAFVQALGQSAVVLGDRTDLDLLISSPVSSKVIFSSRLLSVAIEIFLGLAGFLVLPIGLAVLLGFIRLIGVFPTLFCLCLIAASLAMLIMLWLVQRLGAKKAQVVVQVLATALFALLFLGSQLPNLLLDQPQTRAIAQSITFLFQPGGLLSADSWLWLPARAMFCDPVGLLVTGLGTAGIVWLTITTLHQTFISGTQEPLTTKAQRPSLPPQRFQTNFNRVIVTKEWRMIRRNPYVISQVLFSVVFFIPLLVVLARDDQNQFASLGAIATTACPVLGISLVSGLALVCLNGEEAPDLLRSAPVSGLRIQRLKLLAILLPTWACVVPIAGILILQGEPWVPMVAVFVAATIHHALLRLWNARPVGLAGIATLQKRQNSSKDVVLSAVELVSYLGWLALAFQASRGNGLVVLALALVLAGALAIAYWRSRILGSTLGF